MCEYELLEYMFELFRRVCVTVARENNGEHWFSRPREMKVQRIYVRSSC